MTAHETLAAGPTHYSYSSIKTWHQCPAKWIRRYLFNEIAQPDTIESLIGQFVHLVLENTIPGARSVDQLQHEAKRQWELGEYVSVIEPNQIFMFKHRVWGLLSDYAQLDDPWGRHAVAAEFPLESTVSFRNLRIPFLGYIDRVDQDDTGVTLVDYKTGRQPALMYHESSMRQLMIYAAAIRDSPDWPYAEPKVAKLIYIGSGEVLWHQITPASIAAAEDWFLEAYLAIQHWAPTAKGQLVRSVDDTASGLAVASRLCGWCGYEPVCLVGRNRPTRLRSPQHRAENTKIGTRK